MKQVGGALNTQVGSCRTPKPRQDQKNIMVTFLDLPGELRNAVYAEYFTSGLSKSHGIFPKMPPPPLLCCPEIAAEASGIGADCSVIRTIGRLPGSDGRR